MERRILRIAACVLFFVGGCLAQNDVLADLKHVSADDVISAGFKLSRAQQVEIEGLGYRTSGRWWGTRAWILDARTRDVVWEWQLAERKERKRGLQKIRANADLSEGSYEVYYSVYPMLSWDIRGFGGLLELLKRTIFHWNSRDEEIDKLYLIVRGNGQRFDREEIAKLREEFDRTAVVSIVGVTKNESRCEGFTLEKPTDVEIYALGEARDDGVFDYGWIVDAKSGKAIWKMSMVRSEHAGGAEKNRCARERITLSPGMYMAHYVTDDSHSHMDWNAAPPYDPDFWGLTVRVRDVAAKQFVNPYLPPPPIQKNVIVELISVRNSEVRSKGFALNRPVKVRIYAIGEGLHGKMYDYGWIIDANSHQRAWTMEYGKTEHAGGGNKNRTVEDVVQLGKGDYVAYYTTDDSHSFRDWNTSPPYDAEHWGITISLVEEGAKLSDVVSFEIQEVSKVIARLSKMGDWERARTKFNIDKDTRVRIYALGEGDDGDMVDYGLIENARTGKVVWEMTYDMTERAGGAHKNRMVEQTVTLAPGEYILRYVSDGSHSYDNWNDAPPYDLDNWGITLYRATPP